MSNLLNSYPVFENNQVLTSSQLNELTAYLEEQNRLTRAKLIGTGIACGLELSYDPAVDQSLISIKKGMGITSEGYLITLGNCTVNRRKDYALPPGVVYPPFQNSVSKNQDVSLFEVLTVDAPVTPGTTPLNATFVADKVLMLFIECVDVDLLSCLGKACDDNGKDRVFNLRKLLISKSDLAKVFARSGCGAQSIPFQQKYDLPEIIMKKTLLSSAASNSKDYFSFSQTYANAIKSPVNPPLIQADIYTSLFSALKQTYVDFEPVLSEVYPGGNPFNGLPLQPWTDFMNGSSVGPKYLGMQYFYDFIKDLILAYNEFRNIALTVMSQCCADMGCYPKHLMLGEVIASGSDKPSIYRHYFIRSAVKDEMGDSMESLIFYHKRLALMTTKFDLSVVNPSAPVAEIFITPSNEKRGALSKRSIPYYYKINDGSGGLGTLLKTWDYNYKLKDLYSKGLSPLAYGNQLSNPQTDTGPVKTPLFYDTDPYDFLRIEGHLKLNYSTAKGKIETLKNSFNLPFNVVALRLSPDSSPPDNLNERCNFDDLRTEYGSLRTELTSLMQNVFDRYATITDNVITVKPKPAFLNGLIADEDVSSTGGSVSQTVIGTAFEFTTTANASERTFKVAGKDGNTGAVVLPLAGQGLSVGNFVAALAPQGTLSQIITRFNNDVLQLVTELNSIMKDFLPFNITDFNFGYTGLVKNAVSGFIQHYFIALGKAIDLKVDYNQMLDVIVRNTKIRNTPELYMTFSSYWSEVVGLLDKFITDARYKSLTLVNYSLQYRLKQLKDNDMTLFSNFIKKHPGIEHQAGVKPGGTFILLYNGASVSISPAVRDSAIDASNYINALKARRELLISLDALSIDQQNELTQINSLLTGYTQVVKVMRSNRVPIESINLAGDQVIADFSLPYLYCCDCECEDISHATTAEALQIPLLSPPFYAEYSLGDYAFGKDVTLFSVNGTTPAPSLSIDIIPMLQYEHDLYPPTSIRLHLVDRFGNKVNYPSIFPSGTIVNITPMGTRNYPNAQAEGSTYGTVSVVYDKSFSTPQKFIYTPGSGSFKGVDSFYYMFEIKGSSETDIVRRSSVGKVTINVV